MDLKSQFLAEARLFLHNLPVGTEITVDEVRRNVTIPDGIDPRIMGRVFNIHGWESRGYQLSNREECHKSNRLVVRRKVCA